MEGLGRVRPETPSETGSGETGGNHSPMVGKLCLNGTLSWMLSWGIYPI